MKKQQKEKPLKQLAVNTNKQGVYNQLKKQRRASRNNITRAALNLANQEIERLKKLIAKRVREIRKLRRKKYPPASR